MSQAWLHQRERGSALALRAIAGIATVLGRRAARLAIVPVALYFLLFSVRSRAASRKYLQRVLARAPRWKEVFRHYYTFSVVAIDRLFFVRERYDLFETTLHGEPVLQEMLDRGEGCLLLGAHFGSFEALRALGTTKRIEVALVMYEDNARMVNSVMRALNPRLAQRIIPLGRFDSMLKVYERLQDSQWVGILGDRSLDQEMHVRAPFFGEPASFPTSPFRISLMLKRPVVLMIGLYRGGNRYELYFEKLFEPAGVGRSMRATAIDQAVCLYAQRLEHYCREAPYNWFNFYDFWKGD